MQAKGTLSNLCLEYSSHYKKRSSKMRRSCKQEFGQCLKASYGFLCEGQQISTLHMTFLFYYSTSPVFLKKGINSTNLMQGAHWRAPL
jgi:hypothetical protein